MSTITINKQSVITRLFYTGVSFEIEIDGKLFKGDRRSKKMFYLVEALYESRLEPWTDKPMTLEEVAKEAKNKIEARIKGNNSYKDQLLSPLYNFDLI